MPTYRYRTVGQENVLLERTIVASNRREALQRLIENGQHPLEIDEQSDGSSRSWIPAGLSRRPIRLATFTRQLATLSASGAPIIKGIAVMADQTSDPRAKSMLADVAESVQGGNTLADALAQHPAAFPALMTSMVRVGEFGGTLDEQLLQLAELYEKEEALKGEVQAAIAYPAVVLSLGILSAFILITFFIPRLESFFTDAGQALPVPTRILLATSHAITGHPLLIAFSLVALFIGVRAAIRNPEMKLTIDRAKLRAPWIGTLVRNIEIARFTRLLGTLTRAGVSIVEALNIILPVLQNGVMVETVRTMITRISAGEHIAGLMKQSSVFPPLAVQMVATGEESGHLDEMLLRLADTYDREAAASTKIMMSLLAPALILFVAGIVGFILVSIILPIFQLSNVVK